LLGTIFSFAVASAWVAGASQAATVTVHSPTTTHSPSVSAPHTPTQSAHAAASQSKIGVIKGVHLIKNKPAQMLPTGTPGAFGWSNAPTYGPPPSNAELSGPRQ
jgi:hypothetical protein